MSCLQLGYRFAHVLRRMLPIALHLLAKEGAGLTGHDLFLKRVGACFHAFVEEVESATRTRWGQSIQVPPTAGWPLESKSLSCCGGGGGPPPASGGVDDLASRPRPLQGSP